MTSRSVQRYVERSVHVLVVSGSLTLSERVLRCLSVTAVTIATATDLAEPWGEPPPNAVIVLADGYSPKQIDNFVRDRLSAPWGGCIVLVSEDADRFKFLCEAEGADRRVATFSLSVWGWNVIDAILSLSANLALDLRRIVEAKGESPVERT